MKALMRWSAPVAVALLCAFAEPPAEPFQFYHSAGRSMLPNIELDDVLMATGHKGTCAGVAPAIGDVVAYHPNVRDADSWSSLKGTTLLHRVVAGPGDRVVMKSGRLVINGTPTAIEQGDAAYKLEFDEEVVPVFETLPGGRRFRTLAGAEYGYVNNTEEITVPAGYWFVMGDNRDNSLDSRTSGPVPQSAICAIVTKVFYSKNGSRMGEKP